VIDAHGDGSSGAAASTVNSLTANFVLPSGTTCDLDELQQLQCSVV